MPTLYDRTRLLIAALLLTTMAAEAQLPRTISYQGVLADAVGNFMPDGNYTLQISLYDSQTGGTKLFTETHSAAVVRGVFNLIIGSSTPIPASVRFDRAYFLEVSVNGTALLPRTTLTAAPYAMRAATAELADNLSPAATGIVRSVNGASGNLTFAGDGGTTVSRSGETITITSTATGGTGIQGLRASDSSVAITTPAGPTAGVAVSNLGITTAKIASAAVTNAKLGADAVTSDKIENGTIVGDDINSSTALLIGKLTNTGNATIGTVNGGARLVVQGGGTTSPGAALSVLNSAGTSLLHVRNDGNVGVGTANPNASLEVAGAAGLLVSGGSTVFSSTAIPAGVTITIPPNRTLVEIMDDGANTPNTVILPAGAAIGQILIISNNDAQATTGPAAIAPGQARMYVSTGAALWRLVN